MKSPHAIAFENWLRDVKQMTVAQFLRLTAAKQLRVSSEFQTFCNNGSR